MVKELKKETDFAGYDAFVFGSPTYHGDMLQPMKTMLFLAEKANLGRAFRIINDHRQLQKVGVSDIARYSGLSIIDFVFKCTRNAEIMWAVSVQKVIHTSP